MTTITEAGTAGAPGEDGLIPILIITEGRGSSGVYPSKTLEAAGRDNIFHKGVFMYADHATTTESYDRPERSIKDLAAVLATDAVYDESHKGLRAWAKPFSHWRDTLQEMAPHIGVSISAHAEVDESSGTPVIKRITRAQSVDFVTQAGRGGRVMEVGEAATPSMETIVAEAAQYLTETTPAPGVEPDPSESPTVGANTQEEPVADTTNPPAPVTEATTEHVAESARITELEEAVQAHRAEITEANNRVRAVNTLAADLIVREAFDGITAPRAVARIVEAAVAEAGHDALDADALRETAVAEAAEYRAAHGAGTPSGLGVVVDLTESTTNLEGADYDRAVLTALHGGI